ncbi:MAG: GNAT family N-acetyltransferase [Clostridiales bacterium]|nr:GNAT family N-acetyltransferase [Clostridiales bacterium]
MSRLTESQIDMITDEFYSCFCGIKLSDTKDGVTFVCSESRNEEVKGFGCKYSVYVLVKDDVCIVSYAPKYADFFQKLKEASIDDILLNVESFFKIKKMQLMKFKHECVTEYGNAKVLKKSDYPLYEEFFRLNSPNADPSGWLQEYFEEKAEKEYFVGCFSNGKLVSVCDAPDMPYMEDIIQHTGIVTLKNERRKGYAKLTVALAAHHLIEMGVCPQWECHVDNAASIALAESIGYEKYGIAYIFEE